MLIKLLLENDDTVIRLPVIVGFGGVNAAGRSSFHHAYRRIVLESLDSQSRDETVLGLAVAMNLVRSHAHGFCHHDGHNLSAAQVVQQFTPQVLDSTLIRRLEPQHFNPDQVPWQQRIALHANDDHAFSFTTAAADLPEPLPPGWTVEPIADDRVRVTAGATADFKIDSHRSMPAQAAGQLPTGFDPGSLYGSRFHPRGLQMAVVGASDAIQSVGIDWTEISAAVSPDDIGVYAGSSMSQLDECGNGGMMQARLKGGRVTSRQCALGMPTMPADFINAYVLGSVGTTGNTAGACATFLYNLRIAVADLQAGRCRVAIVGNSEAPLTPEVFDGYGAMGALATDTNLRKLDGSAQPDYRRASRPFGENCGFVLAESAQFVVLFDDALAMELGAEVYGAVTDVFVNADGVKRSISAPGPGNYVTLAKAVAAAHSLLGETALRHRSFVSAHGSSTPLNRETESRVFDLVARAFDIRDWPLTAVKAYVGHSLGPASGDQLTNALGIFRYGIVPGIKTIDAVAQDVYAERMRISTTDFKMAANSMDIGFINTKGFGGNNATATVLAPHIVQAMLEKRYGSAVMRDYQGRRDTTLARASEYDARCLHGPMPAIYRFGEAMVDEDQIQMDPQSLRLPGYANPIDLRLPNCYADML